jgi:hypothetical protein
LPIPHARDRELPELRWQRFSLPVLRRRMERFKVGRHLAPGCIACDVIGRARTRGTAVAKRRDGHGG